MGTIVNVCCFVLLSCFHFCHADICLKSSFTSNSLILNCKIDNIESKVSFFNQLGQEQGYCVIPYPAPYCISYYKNGSITQNLTTSETILTIQGEHSSQNNGNWSCRHGTNIEKAFIEVRVNNQIGLIPAIFVSISGPESIRTNEPMWITCFASTRPVRNTVNFLVNDSFYASLSYRNGRCFSSKQIRSCGALDCQCSEDGKLYSLLMNSSTPGKVTVTCELEFESVGLKRDCIFGRIYDIKGPFISTSKQLPIRVETVLDLYCSVFGEIKNITLQWACSSFDFPTSVYRNATMLSSILSVKVRTEYHNSSCLCTAKSESFKTSKEFVFLIKYEPVLDFETFDIYNSSTNITLICTARGNFSSTKFEPWIHRFNGNFIRYIKGTSNQISSTLQISNSSYEDSGEYICRAFNELNHIKYITDVSRSLVVKGLPVIIETYMTKGPNAEMGVKYYAWPEPDVPQWFLFQNVIDNSYENILSVTNKTLLLFFHGTPVICNGFAANLVINYNSFKTPKLIFSVLIKNEFGSATQTFVLVREGSESLFTLRSFVGIIVISSTVLIIAVAVSILCRGRLFKKCKTTDDSRAVYFTVHPDSNINVYDSTNYEEIGNIQAIFVPSEQTVQDEADKDEEENTYIDFE